MVFVKYNDSRASGGLRGMPEACGTGTNGENALSFVSALFLFLLT